MRLPTIQGVIERRVLVNYRVDVGVLQRLVPAPFRVKTVAGFGVAGVCLIRLAQMRPRFWPAALGFGSENAAHRIAVEWDTADGVREGVFVPRRDTSSVLNVLLGGRLFPGQHHRARFQVHETPERLSIAMRSKDGQTWVDVEAVLAQQLPESSVFGSIEAASAFFERGSIGYSATDRAGCFECLELKSFAWKVEPLTVARIESSFFADLQRFPAGTVTFDSAFLMRTIPHEWRARDALAVQRRGSEG
ncbi:MAG: DUF2071 domain-containing protein [Planctomycetota bacterium]